MNIILTGANGFIGRQFSEIDLPDCRLIGIDISKDLLYNSTVAWELCDLTDSVQVTKVIGKYPPDWIIHCAGIAHQKIGSIGLSTYMKVNSQATANLARIAAKANRYVRFIYLSTVSVYGEKNLDIPVSEESICSPSSDYAISKLDAERRLIALYGQGVVHQLYILRLAPVYDRDWRLNLDKRVLAPKSIAYLRFGSGDQKMSALARPNLVEFIIFLIQNDPKKNWVDIINVCDARPYAFKEIIDAYRRMGIHPNRPVISVPLSPVRLATRLAGFVLPQWRQWFHSCFEKLASDLIFNNEKMLQTGFTPLHELESVFLPKIIPAESVKTTVQ